MSSQDEPLLPAATVVSANVRMMYVQDAFNFAAVSLWNGQLLTLWLYQLCGDTTLIGIGEGAAAALELTHCPPALCTSRRVS